MYSFSISSNYSYITSSHLDIPGVVDNNTVVRMLVSLTSVKLTWDQPEDNNAQITNYNITLCTSVSNDSCVDQTPTTIAVPTTEPMAVLGDLIPVRTYRVYIRAENDAGLGPESQPYFFDSANEGMLCPIPGSPFSFQSCVVACMLRCWVGTSRGIVLPPYEECTSVHPQLIVFHCWRNITTQTMVLGLSHLHKGCLQLFPRK